MKFEKVAIGDYLEVRVEKVLEYKAILRSGELIGSIHREEAAWTRVEDIGKYLKEGDILSVRVIGKTERNGDQKIEFSLRREEDNPLVKDREKYSEGNIVDARIEEILDYGLSVDTDGVRGFIYLSEISWNTVENPKKLYSRGDMIRARITDLNMKRGSLNLSIRELTEDPWKDIGKRYNPGDTAHILVEGLYEAAGLGTLMIPEGEVFAKGTLDCVEAILEMPDLTEEEKRELLGKRVEGRVVYIKPERRHMRLRYIK